MLMLICADAGPLTAPMTSRTDNSKVRNAVVVFMAHPFENGLIVNRAIRDDRMQAHVAHDISKALYCVGRPTNLQSIESKPHANGSIVAQPRLYA